MNDKDNSEELLDLEMADCENISIDDKSTKTAPGYVKYDAASNAGKYWAIYQFKKSSGTEVLIRKRGTTLEYCSGGGGSWVACTVPYALSQIQPTFSTLNDICVFTNGSENVMSSTDGITWTERAGLPKSKIVIHNGLNRLLYMGQSSNPGRIDWSDINDPLTIGASSYQWIGYNDNEKIVGAAITPTGSLLVFKDRHFYDISDVTMGFVSVEPLGICPITSHQTIAVTENSVILFGIDGIYEYMGGTMRKISGKINFASGRNLLSQYNTPTAVYYNGIYYLSIPNPDDSATYNCQEYLVYKQMIRDDTSQPYPITRNKRYFGCYGIEDYTSGSTKRRRLYVGDSRSTTGSPAITHDMFAYVNTERASGVLQGENGVAQTCYFTTKFFTEDIPYHIKKHKRFFTNLKIIADTTITIGYRYDQDEEFTEVSEIVNSETIKIGFEDGSSGNFSEGYAFSNPAMTEVYKDLQTGSNDRGVQFKVSFSTINEVSFLNLSYRFRSKIKYK